MADEEIVAGLNKVENQIVRQREDGSKQTGQLTESINKLRSENNQKSDGIVGTLTSSLEDNASEIAAGFVLQSKHHSFLKDKGMDKVDDEVLGLRSDLSGDNDEQKSLLQRIAQWVNPDMQGSKDRERDLENKLNFNKQTEFFANMTKSLAGMVVKPIRATAAGIWTFLKGLAFGGALLGLLNFLDGDTWKDWQKWIIDVLPGKIIKIKDAFGEGFFTGLTELAVQLGLWDKGIKGISMSNTGIAAIIVSIGIGLAIFGKMFKGIRAAMVAAGIMAPAAMAAAPGAGLLGKPEPAKGTIPGERGQPARQVVQSAAGKWTIAGAGGVPTVNMVPTADIEKIKVTAPVIPAGGSGAGKAGLANRAKFILRKIPWIGHFLAIKELLNIVESDMPTDKKIAGIAGLVSGLGGSILGGIAGAFVGAPIGLGLFSWLTGALGSGVGAFLGFNFAQQTGTAFAEYILGESITAYDDVKGSWKGMLGMGSDTPPATTANPSGASGTPTYDGGAGNDTLGAGTWSAKLMKAGGTPMPRAAPGRANITPTPTPDRGSAMTDWSATKSAQAYNGGGAGGGSTNVIAPSNTVNNNQSSTTVTSKSLSNPSPLLNAVNFAT
jgi:hypothetical protein